MTIENNPYEIGLGWTVNLEKPSEFIGKAALQKIKDAGPRRKLVGIEIDGPRIEFNMTKWPVRARGKEIRRATSAIHSPRLKKNIGYATVPIACSDTGTADEAIHPAGTRKARVVKEP